MPSDGFERWMDDANWMNTPFILAIGIREDGRTERREDGKEQFYFIYKPNFESEIGHTPIEDSDDDAQDIIFCHNPPPYTVARVKKRLEEFLNPRMSFLRSTKNISLEPLSHSTPEIVETSTSKRKDGRYVRFGLFPQ